MEGGGFIVDGSQERCSPDKTMREVDPYSHAMRITVPTIPQYLLTSTSTRPTLSKAAAIDRIATFLDGGNTTIITGAGVSVDSGIRAYRGKDGRYMNPNYKCVQVFV